MEEEQLSEIYFAGNLHFIESFIRASYRALYMLYSVLCNAPSMLQIELRTPSSVISHDLYVLPSILHIELNIPTSSNALVHS